MRQSRSRKPWPDPVPFCRLNGAQQRRAVSPSQVDLSATLYAEAGASKKQGAGVVENDACASSRLIFSTPLFATIRARTRSPTDRRSLSWSGWSSRTPMTGEIERWCAPVKRTPGRSTRTSPSPDRAFEEGPSPARGRGRRPQADYYLRPLRQPKRGSGRRSRTISSSADAIAADEPERIPTGFRVWLREPGPSCLYTDAAARSIRRSSEPYRREPEARPSGEGTQRHSITTHTIPSHPGRKARTVTASSDDRDPYNVVVSVMRCPRGWDVQM
jgi:hypothetical protein